MQVLLYGETVTLKTLCFFIFLNLFNKVRFPELSHSLGCNSFAFPFPEMFHWVAY